MESLPSEIFIDIIQFLSVKDIFLEVIVLCKSLKSSIQLCPFLLGRLIQLKLGLQRSLRPSYAEAQDILQRALTPSISSLDFRGFASSGGFDEDHPSYWVSNLYRDDGTGYCSRDNKNNINTAGVLSITQQPVIDPDSYNYFIKIFDKCEIIARSVFPFYKGNRNLSMFQIKEFRELYLSHTREIVAVLAAALKQTREDVNKELKEAFGKFKEPRITPADLRRRPEDMFVTLESIDYETASHGEQIAVISKVELSRQGGFTCPVETFMVFVSEIYVDIEDEEFNKYNKYNNLLIFEDVEQRFPGATRGRAKDEEGGIDYCEFIWSASKLKPVLWGKFTNRRGNVITAKLRERFTGNYLYSKLINPENRMAEMNDTHPSANIDCNYLLAFGSVVSLKPNLN